MKLHSFRYVGSQAVKAMRGDGWMTIAAILTITISLFLCTSFWLLLKNIEANVNDVEEEVRVVAYLDYDINTAAEYDQMEKTIRKISGVAEVEFISKDEGLDSLADRFGNIDLIDTLGDSNPLPDCFSISVINSDDVAAVAAACEKLAGVSSVRYGGDTVEKLFALTTTLRQVGLAVMLLLAIAAMMLISIAVRLTIVSRKKEIMIMKWVGATNAFIRWPFFLEGLILGFLGSAVALGLVFLTYTGAIEYISNTVPFITVLPLSELWLNTSLFALGAGLLLGAIGSVVPISRALNV